VHTSVCLSIDFFPVGFLQGDDEDMEYASSVSLKLSHCVIGVFHNITELDHSFFSLGF
jgi:hypothetical protein